MNNLISILDVSVPDLERLMADAARLKAERAEGCCHPLLAGKSLAMIFEKPSTRTRVSFEVGMYELRRARAPPEPGGYAAAARRGGLGHGPCPLALRLGRDDPGQPPRDDRGVRGPRDRARDQRALGPRAPVPAPGRHLHHP